MNNSIEITNAFLLNLVQKISPKKTLILNFSNPSIIDLKVKHSIELKDEISRRIG